MRQAMICVTVMFALLQLWPIAFAPARRARLSATTVTQDIPSRVHALRAERRGRSRDR